MFLEGGIVDQHVEPAPAGHHLVDCLLAEFHVLDVARHGDAALAFGFDAALGFGRVFMLVEVKNRDVGPFARKQHRHRAADAGVAAGDDRHLALQLATALVMPGHEHGFQCHVGFGTGFAHVLHR